VWLGGEHGPDYRGRAAPRRGAGIGPPLAAVPARHVDAIAVYPGATSGYAALNAAAVEAGKGTNPENNVLERTMPKAWSNKDERMYDHIKESAEDRGASEDRAEEIAARTVNKHRREEGRTRNRRSQGTGNPNRRLEERTVVELRNIAADRQVRGRSKMNKHELVDALRKAS